ncbi:MAG TPA: 4-(cytidine 5'-diphospho)-2-C-methyl-D-erythritol kinase [Sphingobacteriaceae bacterium]
MVAFPNAKINIGLNITERRSDGYHNLETIFYPVAIRDALEVVESADLTFTSTGIGIPGAADSNLCLKAFRLLAADLPVPNVHIHLHKQIPIGAGLGGGSSDAAFFIRLMNEKFELGLSGGQMEDYCRRLGADCPFFVRNEPVFACGVGDVFRPLSLDLSPYFLVLVQPAVHISTAEAYQGVKPLKPATSLSDLIRLPVEEWTGAVKNDFEASVFPNHPAVRDVKDQLYEAGALYSSMSGSGSSVYGIFKAPVSLPGLEKENQVFYGI